MTRFIQLLLLACWSGTVLAEFVRIDAGAYQPLFRNELEQSVAAFELEAAPVTNAEFLEFVTAEPRWRRSQAGRLFVDERYLSHWAADLEPGTNAPPNHPVTRVSWFAARAYAKWKGSRLPTLAEWEWAAGASEREANGRRDTNFLPRILNWYARPAGAGTRPVRSTFRNVWGAWDMHGLIWEWVEDFNTALVTGESRADSALERPQFCGGGGAGSADVANYAAFMRYAFRSSLKARSTTSSLGFRCARDVKND